jgi:SAM-dependent methyltransferase
MTGTTEAHAPARRANRFDVRAMARLTEMADFMVAFGVRVVADLGVADALAGGPLPVSEIAERTGADPDALHRVLRALACQELFDEPEPGVYGLTAMSELLRDDHPMSLRAGMTLIRPDIEAWAAFDHSVRTGESAFRHVHGCDYWEYMADNPGESDRFDRSQQTMTRLEVQAALRVYDWTGVEELVDLGGGNGAFLAGILARRRDMRGVLVDLPHVVARAPEVLAAHGVADRCRIVAGSFFEDVYAGADAYALKRVVWGHDDAAITGVFEQVRRAMRDGGRLLIFEPGVHEGSDITRGKVQDLRFLALGGGGARTPEHLGELLARAGMQLHEVTPTSLTTIVEARARS